MGVPKLDNTRPTTLRRRKQKYEVRNNWVYA